LGWLGFESLQSALLLLLLFILLLDWRELTRMVFGIQLGGVKQEGKPAAPEQEQEHQHRFWLRGVPTSSTSLPSGHDTMDMTALKDSIDAACRVLLMTIAIATANNHRPKTNKNNCGPCIWQAFEQPLRRGRNPPRQQPLLLLVVLQRPIAKPCATILDNNRAAAATATTGQKTGSSSDDGTSLGLELGAEDGFLDSWVDGD
jgi:hypothetical protein